MFFARPVVAAFLLTMLPGLAPGAGAQIPPQPPDVRPAEDNGPALPGTNRLSSVKVELVDGSWTVNVQYFYTGEPKGAWLRISHLAKRADRPRDPFADIQVANVPLKRGEQTFKTVLPNPNQPGSFFTTEHVVARLQQNADDRATVELASAQADQAIRWPDPKVSLVESAIGRGREQDIVNEAIRLIDSEIRQQQQAARTLLQILVERKPGMDSAYVELARIAMKTNWGPAGLREAETLLKSALQIRPDSVNAKILMGYVYAHQARYPEAESLFAEAARSNPPNLWLWSNWGEVLAMQGKTDAAIQKYREAVKRPPTGDTNDRARQDAYLSLLRLLEARGDMDGVEQAYAQRTREYPGVACFTISYARFLVLERGNAESGLAVLQDGQLPQCEYHSAREVQALAHYLVWAKGPGQPEALHRARAYLPVGPRVFYSLASSERAMVAARKLIAAGEKVDVQDNEALDALGYALREGETDTARRLLQLGAKPDAPEGAQKMPAALIPVLSRDKNGIRLMQKAGIDYAKLRFQGTTAVEYAHGQGDAELLNLLDPRGGKL